MPSRLTKVQIDKVLEHKDLFQKVEAATNVPWQAVAALWTRESFSVASPKTPGGPFQFDPVPPDARLRFLLDRYTNLGVPEKLDLVARGVDEFKSAAYFAACHGRDRANPVITPDVSDEDIKDFFWGYNGKAYGAANKSPYVMNGFDTAHDGMVLTGTIPDKNHPGKRIRIKPRPERRPGAFTVYKQLKGEI